MFYSYLKKKWIKRCMHCRIALMRWKTNVEIVYIDRQNFWYNEFLKKYFIIAKEFHEIRSECGYWINISCKAYMKFQ